MKTYESPTSNRGKTIILDGLHEAVAIGSETIGLTINKYKETPGDQKVRVNRLRRDGKSRTGVTTIGKLLSGWNETAEKYDACATAITEGDPFLKEQIADLAARLRDMALDLEPSLSRSRRGFEQCEEDGIAAVPEALASGEAGCLLRRRRDGGDVKEGAGGGAYRIVINTDVSWFGKPADNAAVMGALVMLLQNAGPCEIWIQQGWMGHTGGDGVTLFKLDFEGAFEPTQLAFWCGHPNKDNVFSYIISRGLGRNSTGTATHAEIECDLYLRGDWMKLAGIYETKFASMTMFEQQDLMARWIAATAMQILYKDNGQGFSA